MQTAKATLTQRLHSLDGIRVDGRDRLVICTIKPFTLDADDYFTGKLIYSSPITMWSDVVGYRRQFKSDRPNEFVFVEMRHSTAKMRLHTLREEAFDGESPDDGVGYVGEVYKFADSPIAATLIAKERLDRYRYSHLSSSQLIADMEIYWTHKSI